MFQGGEVTMVMNRNSAYYRNLIQHVIENSVASTWESAVLEWEVFDCEEDETLESSCICGKEELRYLFTIRNTQNGNLLFPIGSSCIKKFERDDLDEEVAVKEQLFRLLHAIENNRFITLSSDYFSRKLLRYLYEIDAFEATEYNNFNPYNDYQFLLDMFNKRMRTEKQEKKATAIILNSIRPFLRKMLSGKIRRV
jgi:hypothetical protein